MESRNRGYWSQNVQSRGQTVNLSKSSEIESLSILEWLSRNYTDDIVFGGRPNARPCRYTDKRVCTGLRIVIALHKTRCAQLLVVMRIADWQMGHESRGMTNRSCRLQRMRRNYASTDELLPDPRRNTSPSTGEQGILANVEFLLRNLSYHFMHTLFSHDAILRYANAAPACSIDWCNILVCNEVCAAPHLLLHHFQYYFCVPITATH